MARLDDRSIALRKLILRALEKGGRGHLASAFSLVEVLRALYEGVLVHRPTDPAWSGRDRCILSKGHGCLALYAVLADRGYFPVEELDRFCSFDSMLGGHPERDRVPGVEASTGALGHGLSIGVGQAMALRMRGQAARVFVIMGDGETNEGSVWEGAMCAAKHRLDNLVAVVDYNKMQSYGPTSEVMGLEPLADKWRSFGFVVREADGHDLDAVRSELGGARCSVTGPTVVICHTVKGRGVDFVENNAEWHHTSKLKPGQAEALHRGLEAQRA